MKEIIGSTNKYSDGSSADFDASGNVVGFTAAPVVEAPVAPEVAPDTTETVTA